MCFSLLMFSLAACNQKQTTDQPLSQEQSVTTLHIDLCQTITFKAVQSKDRL
ncbi:hypothetical protein [Thomasclavelia saccharogumia]|uniref:hypothetical protein n=1 Tax=Thomasclavelia saccharogumia TaxID=341225 RepID=UPI00164E9F7F|nr:hypothetical protein [Thomasclavelia saccharogumia]